jgi:acyl transferase domain-containing protein/acyl carrier protein
VDADRALDEIAVIGMRGRMPGAPDLETFWTNLSNGVESSTVFSDEEVAEALRQLDFNSALLSRPNYVKIGYLLDRVEWFDPGFFGLSSKDAELIDPQHRLFLECAWETLENAGYAPGPSCPRTGVFAGCSMSHYLMANLYHHVDFSKAANPLRSLIANDKDYLTTRTSYMLDLKGPSVGVQSACSTSLVAVCLACDSLRDYQCDLALAGGVTVMIPQRIGYLYEEGNVYSPDGHCRPFDAKAAGTVFGSGLGIVALKRLEDAQADGDHILAVIKDTAVNNDGVIKVGFTAPSEMAQAEVIAMAHKRAQVTADTITYVETHGTGTQLGDPIEIAALTRAFRNSTPRNGFCAIGSVKSNLGHLQAAAGIASLIKTILALQHKTVPPSLNFTEPHPAIDFANSPFYVSTNLSAWNANGSPRRAGVSSFGMGGTNAHIVLEEPPSPQARRSQLRSHYLLPLSAKSEKALRELAKRYEAVLAENPDCVADICFTAAVGRAHFSHRLAVVGEDSRSLREQLAAFRPTAKSHVSSEWHELLQGLARQYERGENVDWSVLGPGRRLPLPTYPFERQRCWVEPAAKHSARAEAAFHPLLGRPLSLAESNAARFESAGMPPFLKDHVVAGKVIFPAAAYWEMALAAAERTLGLPASIHDSSVSEPLFLDGRSVQTVLEPGDHGGFNFRIYSSLDAVWVKHAEGRVSIGEGSADTIDLGQLHSRFCEPVSTDAFYSACRKRGLEYGPAFQSITELWRDEGQALGRIQVPDALLPDADQYQFHPVLLDGCMQISAAALGETETPDQIRVPVGLGRMNVTGHIGLGLWAHACRAGEAVVLNVYDEAGARVAELQDVRFAAVSPQSWRSKEADPCYQILWRPKSLVETEAPASPAKWLIFMDGGKTGAELANLLEGRGDTCVRVFRQDVKSANANDSGRLLTEAAEGGFRGVIYLWGLNSSGEITMETLERSRTDGCAGLLHLIRELVDKNLQPAPRLWIVTRETQAVGGDAVRQPDAAPLWGLARVLGHEHRELGCVCIDLGQEGSGADLLLAELQQCDGEDRIAYRGGNRHVARLASFTEPQRSRPSGPFRLSLRDFGSPEYLELAPASRRAPGPDEVEIEVRDAGLNLKDVLVALARVSPAQLGSECAGVVCAVGDCVRHLRCGDPVFVAAAPGCLASHVTVPAACVFPKPDDMSFAEAATTPIAFLTAYHSLVSLAKLRPGDKVLIHSAATGVGLSGVRLALRLGAEVFATASPSKRSFLRTIGIEHISSSRCLDFATEIAQATGGRGVDVVLNSLTGQFVDKSFEVLAKGGRFVELGKLDTWDQERVSRERPDVTYFKFDLGEEAAADPDLVPAMLEHLHTTDPLPSHFFPIEDAPAAFRFMAQGKHIGKIVLSTGGEEKLEIRREATYLITGGLGALGRQVAQRLIKRGASHLVLVGRHASNEAIEDLSQTGVRVAVIRADVAKLQGIAAITRLLESGWPPLRGVIHAAGVVDDGILLRQSDESLAAVMAPKVAGAWNLHELTQHRRLDFFICFSSVSSVLGAPGQGNYAAANAFLDALAHYRRSLGLPGLTINWGPWADSGMATRNANLPRLATVGIDPINSHNGLDLLEKLSLRDHPQVIVLSARWQTLGRAAGKPVPFLEELVRPREAAKASATFLKALHAAPERERQELLDAYLRGQVARVLGLPSPEAIEPHRRLFDLGLDSLGALELRNLLESGLGTPLRATLLFDYSSIAELRTYLMSEVIGKQVSLQTPRPAKETSVRPGDLAASAAEPIAIIGLGCRFPGSVESPSAYWKLLCGGVDAITEVPSYRWSIDDFYDPDPRVPHKIYTRSGGFLGPVEDFDPHFFGMSPREAVSLDPQQRLLLETSWEALEYAQLPSDQLFGSDTGVFLGISMIDNATNLRNLADPQNTDAYYGTGNSMSGAVGRLSYMYGLKGPCMAVETACSSSLVAVHLACRSLLNGECRMALAAGVNLILAPEASVVFSRARMLASDGRCKAFSDAADGYGRGEGCGVVMLERLSDALKNRHRIVALIRGSAVNQDGASGGLTVPNGPSQQAVIRQALHNGGVDPALVGYIEAHGTGTGLGDPIEVNALGAVFGQHRSHADPLIIGTVKSNIGHLESAAGIAGLVKLALCLHNRQIPASLHFDRPNRNIPWNELPVRVATALEPWPARGKKRVGGVSSFGFAGTNAHVVMEEAPVLQDELVDRELPCRLLTFSAKTEAALKDLTMAYERFLAVCPEEDFANACNGANTGRTHFKYRTSLVATSAAEGSRILTELRSGRMMPGVCTGKAAGTSPRVAFLFTGQGSQYAGMGRQLYETEPTFRTALQQCASILAPLLEKPLLEVLYASDSEGLLHQTACTQPALFAVEYALAKLWESWGIRPAALLGHSIGEYVAACLAGVFRLEDGLELVAVRGRLMQALPAGGGMVAVFAEHERVRTALAGAGDEVCVAAVNGPQHTVVSGRQEKLEAALAPLAAEGVRLEKLNVSHAFHSPLMEPMLPEFRRAAARIQFRQPEIPVISNITGEVAGVAIASPDYWTEHILRPVQFDAGMRRISSSGCRALLEIGPHPVLLAMGRQCVAEDGKLWLESLRRGLPEWRQMLLSLGRLYTAGATVNWEGFDVSYEPRRVTQPTYPFQRKLHWVNEPEGNEEFPGIFEEGKLHPLLGRRIRLAGSQDVRFQARIGRMRPGFLDHHQVFDNFVVPMTAYLEAALAAGEAALGTQRMVLEDVVIQRALILPESSEAILQTVLVPDTPWAYRFEIYSLASTDSWTLHAVGRVLAGNGSAGTTVRPDDAEELSVDDHYRQFARRGIRYGRDFRTIRKLLRTPGGSVAKVSVEDAGDYLMHPALLDGCLQACAAAAQLASDYTYVPAGLARLELFREPGNCVWTSTHTSPSVGLELFDETDAVVCRIEGVSLRRVSTEVLGSGEMRDALYKVAWKAQPLARSAEARLGTWAIVSDPAHVGSQLATEFRKRGHRAVLAESGDGRIQIPNLSGIVHFRGLRSALELAQRANEPIWLVTRGAQAVGESQGPLNVEQAPIWGLGRTIAVERPETSCRCLDLDPAKPAGEIRDLADEILHAGDEDQVAWRDGVRFVARLERRVAGPRVALPEWEAFQLEIAGNGVLAEIQLQPAARRQPGPGEVEIRVAAAALNFRDVLCALEILPDQNSLTVGSECAGTVVEVGAGVDGINCGDEVVALAPGSMASSVTVPQRFVFPKLICLSMEEAAALPIVFLTAYYGLHRLAKIQAGERILIHAAAGGVGQAAIQLARKAGAEVFATASPAKWGFLEAAGVRHIMNSRTLNFAEQVLELTDGHGVDVVLNCLNGEFIPKSFEALRRGGRFLEIGKIDTWDEQRVREVRPDASYFVYDIAAEMANDPSAICEMLAEIMTDFRAGRLRPPTLRVFPITEAADAFRVMAAGGHIGKVILSMESAARPLIRGDGSYLIAGGLGELGLKVAGWMARRGARRVLLCGRGKPAVATTRAIDEIRREGTQVEVIQADIASVEGVKTLVAVADRQDLPLRGIVHVAGVLRDRRLSEMSWEDMQQVLRPKVEGAWNLHLASRGCPLDFFVCFSSMASTLGSAGQANYAAANAFLDTLAYHRRAAGLPCLTINWGPWGEGGMAARLGAEAGRRRAANGIGDIAPETGLRVLDRLLSDQDAIQVMVAPIDWQRFLTSGVRPFFEAVAESSGPKAESYVLSQLRESAPDKRRCVLTTYVAARVAKAVGLASGSAVGPDQRFMELGIDSLVAIELRNRLQADLGSPLAQTVIFDYPTLPLLVEHLETRLFGKDEARTPTPPVVNSEIDDFLNEIGILGENEVKNRLAREQH